MNKVTLSKPLGDAPYERLRNATKETRGLTDPEIGVLLELEEHALRSDFAIYGTDADTNEALGRAMLIGFPSFLKQMNQTASLSIGAENYSHTTGEVVWPGLIGRVLSPYVTDDGRYSSVTELRRPDDHLRGDNVPDPVFGFRG